MITVIVIAIINQVIMLIQANQGSDNGRFRQLKVQTMEGL